MAPHVKPEYKAQLVRIVLETGKSVAEHVRFRIAAIFDGSNQLYGSPKIHRELREGIFVSRKRVARLMRAMNLRSRRKRRFRATTDSNHALPIAENGLSGSSKSTLRTSLGSRTSPIFCCSRQDENASADGVRGAGFVD